MQSRKSVCPEAVCLCSFLHYLVLLESLSKSAITANLHEQYGCLQQCLNVCPTINLSNFSSSNPSTRMCHCTYYAFGFMSSCECMYCGKDGKCLERKINQESWSTADEARCFMKEIAKVSWEETSSTLLMLLCQCKATDSLSDNSTDHTIPLK